MSTYRLIPSFGFLLCLLLSPILLSSQNFTTQVQYFGSKEGLSHVDIQAIHQDQQGFIWLGTNYGLNRFDGYNFRWYTREKNGLQSNRINHIAEDKQGWMWLFFTTNPIFKAPLSIDLFHPETEEVFSFEEKFGPDAPLQVADITSFAASEDGRIAFTTNRRQLVIYDPKNGFTSHPIDNYPLSLEYFSTRDEIWGYQSSPVSPQAILYCINTEGKVLYRSEKNGGYPHYSQYIGGEDEQGKLYYISKYGNNLNCPIGQLFQVDANKRERPHPLDSTVEQLAKVDLNSPIVAGNCKFSRHPKQGSIWMGTADQFQIFHPSEGWHFDLAPQYPALKRVNTIVFDDQDRIWVGSTQGLFLIEIRQSPFRKILHSLKYNGTQGFTSRGLATDRQNRLWAGNDRIFPSLWIFDPNRQEAHPVDTSSFRTGLTYSLLKDRQGNIWAGFSRSLMGKYLPEQDSSIFYPLGLQKNGATEVDVWSMFEDQQGNIWFGTDIARVGYIDPQGQVHHLPPLEGLLEKGGSIYQFVEGPEGLVWLATDHGLFSLDVRAKAIRQHITSLGKQQSLSFEGIYHIHVDSSGHFWLGSRDMGLIRWHPQGQEYRRFTQADGLSNSTIYSIYEDGYGNLWLSSNYGLIQFDKKNWQGTTYLEEDGISHNEFNRVSHYQAPDGSLYFGGLNGITYFHPENLQKKQLIDLPLVLTHFQQFDGDQNQLVDRTAELQQTPTISMATSDRFFRLEFSLLSFTDASNNRYAYKVEGVDADWNYQSENFIRLSRLPFGTHRMRIKGQTSNGHWSSQELAFQVVVARPFYLRWWFFVLLAGLLLGGILGWTRRRNAQYRMQQEALEKLVLERTEQIRKDKQTIEQQAEELRQLDSVKSRFFANISHELRTPLTLILGPLASVIDSHDNNPKNQQLLLLMQQNGKQLLRLVDEIMDLTKLEAGKMQLQLEATQLQVLIRRIAAAFYALAEKEGIQFSVDYQADPDLCIWLDVHKFEMLVANLLSNAFKFSSQAGRVVLQIIQETDQLHLQVQDSGRGIHPDDLPHIFNRFYQTRREDAAAEGGTGIGLALCTEFAKLFNGRVWAESEWGQGSTFHFAFPLQLAPNNSLTPSLDMPIEPVADASAQSDPPLAVEGVGKRSILIVEDHSDLRNYLKSILDDHHHCHLAENGADAIKQLEHLTPDLILSDIMMPVMDGFQLLEKLKSQDEWRHIPIVMLTARSELSDKLKALRIGVDDYLLKPFEAEELLVRINNLLRNGQLKQQETKTNGTSDASSSSPLISQEEQAWLHQLEELLQKNLDKPHFKIDQMAESMHISRRQLFRNIKRLTGLTPNQYLQENRLQKARQCVENREFRTVKAVAYASGFSNVGYFTKLYKRRFGKLPSDSSLKVN